MISMTNWVHLCPLVSPSVCTYANCPTVFEISNFAQVFFSPRSCSFVEAADIGPQSKSSSCMEPIFIWRNLAQNIVSSSGTISKEIVHIGPLNSIPTHTIFKKLSYINGLALLIGFNWLAHKFSLTNLLYSFCKAINSTKALLQYYCFRYTVAKEKYRPVSLRFGSRCCIVDGQYFVLIASL